jgi:transposase
MEKQTLEQEYQQMRTMLNEKQWRQYLAAEAKQRGSVSEVARAARVSLNTVKQGLKDLEAGELYRPGERIRKAGGGMKKRVETDATLLADLEAMLDPKGDPMSLVRWTTKSLAHLVKALEAQGHHIKKSALAEVLHAQGFSLRANKKTIEGTAHPDRDEQFRHINGTCQEFEQKGAPIISVDCKKKELIGNFKHNGRQWQAKGEETCVNVYDFLSLADGRAIPYGI